MVTVNLLNKRQSCNCFLNCRWVPTNVMLWSVQVLHVFGVVFFCSINVTLINVTWLQIKRIINCPYIMKRTSDSGQLWITLIGNRSDENQDLIQTIVQMACSHGPAIPPHGLKTFPGAQSTCRLVLHTPLPPLFLLWGYIAGPLFHNQDENHTIPLESEKGQTLLSSTLP